MEETSYAIPSKEIRNHFPSYVMWTEEHHPRLTGKKIKYSIPTNGKEDHWGHISYHWFKKNVKAVKCYNGTKTAYYYVIMSRLRDLMREGTIPHPDNRVTVKEFGAYFPVFTVGSGQVGYLCSFTEQSSNEAVESK